MNRLALLASLVFLGCASAPAAKPDAKVETAAVAAPLAPSDGKTEEACAEHTGMQPKAADATGAKKAFDQKPQPGEKALCAVAGEAFTITADTKIAEYNGKYYAFCCDNCEPEFKADPAKFAGN